MDQHDRVSVPMRQLGVEPNHNQRVHGVKDNRRPAPRRFVRDAATGLAQANRFLIRNP